MRLKSFVWSVAFDVTLVAVMAVAVLLANSSPAQGYTFTGCQFDSDQTPASLGTSTTSRRPTTRRLAGQPTNGMITHRRLRIFNPRSVVTLTSTSTTHRTLIAGGDSQTGRVGGQPEPMWVTK